MSVVESRVLQMEFDNRNFESGMRTSTESIERFKHSLNFSGASAGLSEVAAATKRIDMAGLGNAVESVKLRFSALQVAGVTALANITTSAIRAGEQMVKSLTIEPITQGFQEYELKMNAIRTMMASSGESLKTVNGYLQELNTYSDQTIYSFADMTQNIGKFTNAGVSLKDSVTAIKGIANVAAVSGANTWEASRAMYNFAQALSQGSVRLMDWKSIDLANMGTLEFKNQLLQTAEALGTVTKQGNNYISTTKDMNGHVSEAFNASKGFQESLAAQWLTTDVLIETLKRYTDTTTDIGRKATDAATEVRTFTQLMSTLRESVGSSWATTFEILFGNLDEATQLWTSINNVIGGMLDSMGNYRNQVLGTWKKLGGRKALIEGLTNAFKGLVSVIKPVGEAFQEIFPALTGKQLYEFTDKFRDFSKQLKIGKGTAEDLKNTFKGLFSILKIGVDIFTALASAVGPVLKVLAAIGKTILAITGPIGKAFSGLVSAISQLGIFDAVLSGIGKVVELVASGIDKLAEAISGKIEFPSFEGFGDFLDTLWDKLQHIGSSIANVFSGLLGGLKPISDVFNNFVKGFSNGLNLDTFSTIFNSAVFASIAKSIYGFVHSFDDIFDGLSSLKEGIPVLSDLRECLSLYQSKIQAGTLVTIAAAILMLATSLVAISGVESGSLLGATTAIGALMLMLVSTAKRMIKAGPLILKGATQLLLIAGAVKILASACNSLSGLNLGELATGLAGVGGLLLELSLFAKYTTAAKGLIRTATSMLILSNAMIVLAAACSKFSGMNLGELARGLGSIGILLVEMAGFSKLLTGNATRILAASVGMIAVAQAMVILSQAVSSMGHLDIEEIGRGLAAIGASLTIIGIAVSKMPSSIIAVGAGLLVVSHALTIVASAINTMAANSWDEIGRGLATLGGSMTILAIGLKAMSNSIAGSAALMVAAAALTVLAPALRMLGGMSVGAIAKALVTLAGSFTVLGVAGLVLGPLVPVILGLSAALALIGASVLGLGAGLTLAGAGLTSLAAGVSALAVSGAANAAAFVASMKIIVLGFAGLIPELLLQLGQGLVSMLTFFAESATQIATAVGELITTIVVGIAERTPELVNAGLSMVNALLQGLAQNIGQIVSSFVDIINNILLALAAKVPEFMQAGVELILAMIDGLAMAIESNAPRVREALINLFISMVNAVKSLLGINSPSTVFIQIGVDTIQGFINGILQMAASLLDTMRELISNVIRTISEKIPAFLRKGIEAVQNLANGIRQKISDAVAAATSMINAAIQAVKSKLPEFLTSGGQASGKFGSGISGAVGKVTSAAVSVVSQGISSAQQASSGATAVGSGISQGMANGIYGGQSSVIAAAASVARAAIQAAMATLNEHSPSRVFYEIGYNVDKGFELGISENTGMVSKSARHMSKSVIKTVSATLAYISKAVNDGIELQPKITPVLDLSNVKANSGDISALLSTNRANSIHSTLNKNGEYAVDGGSAIAAGETTFSFVQNNYSPKALSRLDIYRQTKNQFAAMKKGLMKR